VTWQSRKRNKSAPRRRVWLPQDVALNDVACYVPFAGIWTGFRGDRGTKRHRRYLSVISVSGCETIVMNQTVLKNSNQNVFQ
jgi:hypothetical protein